MTVDPNNPPDYGDSDPQDIPEDKTQTYYRKTVVRHDRGGGSTGIEYEAREVPLPAKEKWFKTYWRPAAAWIYLFICLLDFALAPFINMVLAKYLNIPYEAWKPITTEGASIFHLSFGAIIGIAAWGRTKEKINGVGPQDDD